MALLSSLYGKGLWVTFLEIKSLLWPVQEDREVSQTMLNLNTNLRLFHGSDILVLIFGKSEGKIEWTFYFCVLDINKTNVLHLFQTFQFSKMCFKVTGPSDQLIWIVNEIEKYITDKIFSPKNSISQMRKRWCWEISQYCTLLHICVLSHHTDFAATLRNTSQQSYSSHSTCNWQRMKIYF